MSDLRAICNQCKKEFAPLSSARGEEADTCLTCSYHHKQPSTLLAPSLTAKGILLIYKDTQWQPLSIRKLKPNAYQGYLPKDHIINDIYSKIKGEKAITRQALFDSVTYAHSTVSAVLNYLKEYGLISSTTKRVGKTQRTTIKAKKNKSLAELHYARHELV